MPAPPSGGTWNQQRVQDDIWQHRCLIITEKPVSNSMAESMERRPHSLDDDSVCMKRVPKRSSILHLAPRLIKLEPEVRKAI